MTPFRDFRSAVALGAIILSTSACSVHTVPMGGTSVGRARPLGMQVGEVSWSAGVVPDVSATAPELRDPAGQLLNPVLAGGERRFRYPSLDFGISAAGNEKVDFGFSFSRGLWALAELHRSSIWSLSVSPSIFHFESGEGDTDGSNLWSVNLTGLVNARLLEWEVEDAGEEELPTSFDLFAGVGFNQYWLKMTTEGSTVSTQASPFSLVAGASVIAFEYRAGVEAGGVWIEQRELGRELVPTFRVWVSRTMWPRRFNR